MTSLVSVLIPAYNEESYIGEAVESILLQTYRDFEVLVIDDGSNDGTLEHLRLIKDERLRILRQHHQGLVAALNLGLRCARGDIIARLDADDIALPTRLEKQVRFLKENPDVALVGSFAVYRDVDGKEYVVSFPPSDEGIRRYLLRDDPFVHSSVAFRRDVISEVGPYSTKYLAEDYELWVRIAAKYKLAIIPEPLVVHRVRPTSVSGTWRHSTAVWERLRVQMLAARSLGQVHLASLYILRSLGGFILFRLFEYFRSAKIKR